LGLGAKHPESPFLLLFVEKREGFWFFLRQKELVFFASFPEKRKEESIAAYQWQDNNKNYFKCLLTSSRKTSSGRMPTKTSTTLPSL
jgi:hypothetical protein